MIINTKVQTGVAEEIRVDTDIVVAIIDDITTEQLSGAKNRKSQ